MDNHKRPWMNAVGGGTAAHPWMAARRTWIAESVHGCNGD